MIRGRVGYDGSGNKSVKDYLIRTRLEAHKQRMQEILSRKPGTHHGIDNVLPSYVLTKSTTVNPRRKIDKDERDRLTGRANK